MKEFELLVSLGLFNSALMNDAECKFKGYEDTNLVYVEINKHEGEGSGLYDTVLSLGEYSSIFVNGGNGGRPPAVLLRLGAVEGEYAGF